MPPVMMYESQHEIDLEFSQGESALDCLTVVLNDALDWVSILDTDDQAEFWSEVRETLRGAGSRADLEAVVSDWRTTAEALQDPLSRELLLAESHDPTDFFEVERPT